MGASPYEFELQLQIPLQPSEDTAGAFAIDFTLGYMPDQNAIIVMSVMLLPTDWTDVYELCFGIRAKIVSDNFVVTEPEFSKHAADIFVPKGQRSAVADLILLAIVRITSFVQPKHIVMETFHKFLPEKAMKKYDAVVIALADCQYGLADQFRNDDGIDYWTFEKLD